MLQLRNQLIFFNDGAAEIIYTVKQTFFYVMLTKKSYIEKEQNMLSPIWK